MGNLRKACCLGGIRDPIPLLPKHQDFCLQRFHFPSIVNAVIQTENNHT